MDRRKSSLESVVMMDRKEQLKQEIFRLTREYYQEVHASKGKFVPGKTKVNYGGRLFDDEEMVNLVDASLDFWLTAGPWAHKFETRFAKWLGVKYCSLCNSGSSANLLAFNALTAHELGERRINRGDEVITVAAGFPTTVACIVQYGAVPVFVDMSIEEGNMDCSQLEAALSPKTKAVMVAHSLGNPFDLGVVVAFCKKHRSIICGWLRITVMHWARSISLTVNGKKRVLLVILVLVVSILLTI